MSETVNENVPELLEEATRSKSTSPKFLVTSLNTIVGSALFIVNVIVVVAARYLLSAVWLTVAIVIPAATILTVDPLIEAKVVSEIVKVNAPVLLEVAVKLKLASPKIFVTSLNTRLGSTLTWVRVICVFPAKENAEEGVPYSIK